jgi:hypothetical protein
MKYSITIYQNDGDKYHTGLISETEARELVARLKKDKAVYSVYRQTEPGSSYLDEVNNF